MPAEPPSDTDLAVLELLHLLDTPVVALQLRRDPLPHPIVVSVTTHGPAEHCPCVGLGHLGEDDVEKVVERTEFLMRGAHRSVRSDLSIVARLAPDEQDDHLARELHLLLGREFPRREKQASTEEFGRLLRGIRIGTDALLDPLEEGCIGLVGQLVPHALNALQGMGEDGLLEERQGHHLIVEVSPVVRPGDTEPTEVSALENGRSDTTRQEGFLGHRRPQPRVVHDRDSHVMERIALVTLVVMAREVRFERLDTARVDTVFRPGDLVEELDRLLDRDLRAVKEPAEHILELPPQVILEVEVDEATHLPPVVPVLGRLTTLAVVLLSLLTPMRVEAGGRPIEGLLLIGLVVKVIVFVTDHHTPPLTGILTAKPLRGRCLKRSNLFAKRHTIIAQNSSKVNNMM